LRVESQLGAVHLTDVQVTDDPRTLQPVDLVMFCVKLWDSEAAARQVAPLVGPSTAVISFQNGVQKDELMRRTFGDAAVMGGVAYIATAIGRPGVIVHTGTMQRLIFGEFDGRRSARAEALLEASLVAGINAELSTDITRDVWDKFIFLVGLSGTTTTMRTTLGPIREHPTSREFLLDLMREVVAVGRAEGVNLPDDYAEQRLTFADSLPFEMTSSMHHDLDRGNRLEVDWLSGGVVALGERLGVPTPANRAVAAILAPHAAGRASQTP
jgi:2-dehydropantoate 2-reductase